MLESQRIAYRTAALALYALLACGSPLQAIGEESPQKPADRKLAVTVVDAVTKKPIENAKVEFHLVDRIENLATDKVGRAVANYRHSNVPWLRATVRASGYESIEWNWEKENETPPTEVRLELPIGSTFGGTVMDETGKPLSGVEVQFAYFDAGSNSVTALPVKTDAAGRWTSTSAPVKAKSIQFQIDDPSYVMHIEQIEKLDALRNGTAFVRLKRGVKISGRIVDSEGKPFKADTAVLFGLIGERNNPIVYADAKGRFERPQIAPGDTVMTILIAGFPARVEEIRIVEGMKPLEIRLDAAKKISGRVVDAAGKPIAGAIVQPYKRRNVHLSYVQLKTDVDGRFQVTTPMDGEITFYCESKGYSTYYEESPSIALGRESTITLQNIRSIKGTVVDAGTKQPVSNFTVAWASPKEKGSSQLWISHPWRFSAGRFELREAKAIGTHGCAVRIEAPGYQPYTSPVEKDFTSMKDLAVELIRGEPMSGFVRLRNGMPAIGAKVAIATSEYNVSVGNGELGTDYGLRHATTAADGKFELPSKQQPPFRIVAVHPEGYIEATDKEWHSSKELKLKPWKRIEGTVLVDGKPTYSERIEYVPNNDGRQHRDLVRWSYNTTSDSLGHFQFDRVRPASGTLRRVQLQNFGYGKSYYLFSHEQRVQLSAETTRVVVGAGRTLRGRIALPGDAPKDIRLSRQYACSVRPDMPAYPAYLGMQNRNGADRKNWQKMWNGSPTGIDYASRRSARYYGLVSDDGSFSVSGVPAGKYVFDFTLSGSPKSVDAHLGESIGSARIEFAVPDQGADPIDIGVAEVKLFKTAKLGDLSPVFEFVTLDGAKMKSTDLRGKFVLLDFWATWCGPCRGETPNLKAVHEAFGKNPKFAMVGLSLDDAKEEPADYAKEKGLGWTQGFLGAWADTDVPTQFGVSGLPTILLVGPDGRIIATGLRGSAIKDAVAKALAEK